MAKMKLAPTLKDLPAKVFISYSHDDRDFVERLAKDILANGVLVWWDGWEIKVGESMLQKIQEGITVSSYLAIVLSPRSVTSAWVTEELNAALIRQLREKRVIVLPILLENCALPPFLQDKLYADFRNDYSEGLANLLSAIEPPDIGSHGGTDDAKFHHDYAIERGFFDDNYGFQILITSHSQDIPYAVSCHLTCIADESYSKRLNEIESAGYDWAAWSLLYMLSMDLVDQIDNVILIEGDHEAISGGVLVDPNNDFTTTIHVRARRLGKDPGQDILYEWKSVFDFAVTQSIEGIQASRSQEEQDNFVAWLRENPL